MPRVLVLLAEGFEEIETSTIVDVLRRADIEVVLAGLDGVDPVLGSRDMRIVPELSLADVLKDESLAEIDMLVLPGGAKGAENLSASQELRQLIRDRVKADRPVAAICAAPMVLDEAGVLETERFTCYPGWETRLRTEGRQHEAVVDAGTIITSQGPATAMEFALHLVMRLVGQAKSQEIARGLLFTR